VFKVIGIGYVCTLAAQLCKDAGQASVGVQVELFGKVLILVQALPIAAKLMDTLIGIL
jgi:stage III sporulation protein AD